MRSQGTNRLLGLYANHVAAQRVTRDSILTAGRRSTAQVATGFVAAEVRTAARAVFTSLFVAAPAIVALKLALGLFTVFRTRERSFHGPRFCRFRIIACTCDRRKDDEGSGDKESNGFHTVPFGVPAGMLLGCSRFLSTQVIVTVAADESATTQPYSS
jgi:hypothetical protein